MKRRPCWVEIDAQAFEHNYRTLVEACGGNTDPSASRTSQRNDNVSVTAGLELLAIVKADAYGHGLEHCAPAAVRAGAHWLGVTSVEEGVEARALCDVAGFPGTAILAIAGVFPGQGVQALEHRLACVVWDEWQLTELEAAAKSAGLGARSTPVHLELDTGMSRQGVGFDGLQGILARFTEDSPLRLDGLMTHLYAADENDGEATRGQFAVLEPMVEQVFAAGLKPIWLHVGNSAAVMAGEAPEDLKQLCKRFGLRAMARPGLALYGLAPEFEPDMPPAVTKLQRALKPVLAWKTRVVSVREIAPGQVVGYNGTFVASEPMRLALLAVGYADGLKRALSNRGWVLVGGEKAPIVGRISMDQTVVDVTGIDGVVAGYEVVLLGQQGNSAISAEEHARWSGTVSWEIFTSITARVARQCV